MRILSHRRREWLIRKTLRAVARQRVAMVLQPGNVLVIELAADTDSDDAAAAIQTCVMRGWVEVLHQALPTGRLGPKGELPAGGWEQMFQRQAPVYRLTGSGWAAIQSTHGWLLATFWVSVLAVLVGLVTLSLQFINC